MLLSLYYIAVQRQIRHAGKRWAQCRCRCLDQKTPFLLLLIPIYYVLVQGRMKLHSEPQPLSPPARVEAPIVLIIVLQRNMHHCSPSPSQQTSQPHLIILILIPPTPNPILPVLGLPLPPRKLLRRPNLPQPIHHPHNKRPPF